MHGLQKLMAGFGFSSFSGVLGNLINATIPVRQKGHGIDPGGPTISDVMLLVEQRYNAHFTQSWCAHPSAATVQPLSRQTAQVSLSLEVTELCNPNSLAIISMLMRGKQRYLDVGNIGMTESELGASKGSRQWRPHILATSCGSHPLQFNANRLAPLEISIWQHLRLPPQAA